MRKFNINVDGKNYVVEVEEIGGSVATAPVVATPVAPVVATSAPKATVGAGEPVPSPMPGVVLEVCVANGTAVKKGDKVVVLEAMKMANDITAPKDGVVTVAVSKGANVASGETLFTIA